MAKVGVLQQALHVVVEFYQVAGDVAAAFVVDREREFVDDLARFGDLTRARGDIAFAQELQGFNDRLERAAIEQLHQLEGIGLQDCVFHRGQAGVSLQSVPPGARGGIERFGRSGSVRGHQRPV